MVHQLIDQALAKSPKEFLLSLAIVTLHHSIITIYRPYWMTETFIIIQGGGGGGGARPL